MKPKKIEIVHDVAVLTRQHDRGRFRLDSIDVMPVTMDPETFQIIRISSTSERMMGYRPQEIQYKPCWMSYVHPDDRHIPEISPEDLTGDIIRKQYRIIHRDGQIRWVESQYMPISVTPGQPTYLNAIIRDITKSKAA